MSRWGGGVVTVHSRHAGMPKVWPCHLVCCQLVKTMQSVVFRVG